MGQKVHPYGLRVGIIKDWKSRWFASKKDYAKFIIEDAKIRTYVKKSLKQAAVSNIEILRTSEKIRVIIYTARPGIVIGRKGTEIDKLKEDVQGMVNKEILIDIKEVKNPTAEPQLVAENIAFQLERRIPFRQAMKKAVTTALSSGAKGIKIICSGRLGGAEIARTESYKMGKVPLQTLRADIDFGFSEAKTKYGLIGVKVWIYKGDIIKKMEINDGVDAKESKV